MKPRRRGANKTFAKTLGTIHKPLPYFLNIMGSTFGNLFKISTFGESHGGGVGVVIDGCPPQLEISAEEIQVELDRRKARTK